MIDAKYQEQDQIKKLVDTVKTDLNNYMSDLPKLKSDYEDYKNKEYNKSESLYDIETYKGWFAVKIYDRSKMNTIDPVSVSQFKDTIESLKDVKSVVRAFVHIVEKHGVVTEHKDTEEGYETETVPVYNLIYGLKSNPEFSLRVENDVAVLDNDKQIVFDASRLHSAKNNSDQDILILVLHLEKTYCV